MYTIVSPLCQKQLVVRLVEDRRITWYGHAWPVFEQTLQATEESSAQPQRGMNHESPK